MQRIASFVVLVALVLLITFFFFRVMAVFLLPMFFAAILVVVFRPLHVRLVEKCQGRTRLAAGLSTLTILAIVLVPLLLLTVRAGMDGAALAKKIGREEVDNTIGRLRTRLGLATPPREVIDALDQLAGEIEKAQATLQSNDAPPSGDQPADDPLSVARFHLERADRHLDVITRRVDLYNRQATQAEESGEPWNNPNCINDVVAAASSVESLTVQLDELRGMLSIKDVDDAEKTKFLDRSEQALDEVASLRDDLLGEVPLQWLKERTNMDVGDLQELLYRLAAPGMVVSRASRVGGALADLVIGIVVTVLALYYFLADGPAMVETVMRLSPLDDRYEQAMLTEFNRISRAVVVATLLSAVVQGVMAGIGYYVAGLGAVFLLTLLTMMFAMVPFVGAASVWGSCCIYLLLIDRPWAAALLAVYGVSVVSMLDNVIKPMVLHGQSNLHPLLALLSVLGGAKALGPIGILVGPMVVAFMQALLNMLQVEITELGDGEPALHDVSGNERTWSTKDLTTAGQKSDSSPGAGENSRDSKAAAQPAE
ncbi:MAG: AI-2E family transporter [Planctomycetales bacterium]|nr:AI-2E family transporter [Planctomycetales bacterium]